MKTLVAICFLVVAAAHACPPKVEQSCTVRVAGVSFGYMHLSHNNQLRRPGEPARIHQHLILIGPWSVDATGRGPMFGIAAFLAVSAIACLAWKVVRCR